MNIITTVMQVQDLVRESFPRKSVKLSGDVLRDTDGNKLFSIYLVGKDGSLSEKPYTYIHVTDSSIFVSKKIGILGGGLIDRE